MSYYYSPEGARHEEARRSMHSPPLKPANNAKVNITVTIPARRAGEFGQRGEWEVHDAECKVVVNDDKITLSVSGDELTFSKIDLDAALRALNYNPGPIYRGPRVEQ